MLISELCNDYFWIMPKTPRYVDGANIPYPSFTVVMLKLQKSIILSVKFSYS